MDEQKLEKLQTWVKESSRIVFFGGAGVSTESGIRIFAAKDGLYRQRYAYPPETIISHSFYVRHRKSSSIFYRNRMLYPNAKPNVVHQRLAQWERDGKLLAVVTQNIDGLHQMARAGTSMSCTAACIATPARSAVRGIPGADADARRRCQMPQVRRAGEAGRRAL